MKIINTATGLVILGLGYGVYKKFLSPESSTESENIAEKELDKRKLTWNIGAYNISAQRIYTAINGLGTDEEAIRNEIDNMIANKHDWYQLVLSFKDLLSLKKKSGDLMSWLLGDLDKTDPTMIFINDRLRAVGVIA